MKKETILYTKTNCPNCVLIKTMFEAMGVEYVAINTDIDSEALTVVKNTGFMSLPILKLGDEFIGDVKQIQQKALSLI